MPLPPAFPRRAANDAWAAKRRVLPAEPLSHDTIAWLGNLPVTVRPRKLPIEFVRIANALARAWPDAPRCAAVLDDLLIDKRGSRRGFPLDVALEIASLKDYFERVVAPQPQSVWDEVAARRRQP